MLDAKTRILEMVEKYKNNNRDFGYGHAKQALFELILEKFENERKVYSYYMENLPEIEKALQSGAEKARAVANGVLKRVRTKLGFE